MPLFVRCLLWILMAALPLQGSAALLSACATTMPAQAQVQQGCHEPLAASAGTPAQHHSDSDSDSGADGGQSHGKCSTCASCCTAATAPPQSARPPATLPRAARALPAVEAAIVAIFPAGLERPPRAV